MNNRDPLRRFGSLLLLFVIAVALTCLIILFFFRTSIFTSACSRLLSILMPFLYGFVIAYLLRPVCLFLERVLCRIFSREEKKNSSAIRMISVLLSLLLLFAVIVLLLLAVLPQTISSISRIVAQLPAAIDRFQAWLSGLDSGGETSHEVVSVINETVETLTARLQNFLQTSLLPTLQTAIPKVTSSFMDLFGVIKNFGLGCIISVYLLASWEKFAAQGRLLLYSLLPEPAAVWLQNESRFVNRMFSGFITGKLLDSAIIGGICFLVSSIFRFPYAMLVSVIVGATNVIPFFGPYLGAIPSTLLILTVNPYKALLFLIFNIILQQIDGNILGPAILGDRLGISSFWILFSILFFGSLWGLPGMLVGAPVFAVIYDLVERATVQGLRRKNREDLTKQYVEEFPPAQAEKKARPQPLKQRLRSRQKKT